MHYGVRASWSGPEISHLFFADDSILFTRATRQECLKIVEVLNQYEQALGQKVNYQKSEVSFSKSMNVSKKEELAALLGMSLVDKHKKYLGVPTIVGRSKKEIFSSVKERVWKKLKGWKERFLSTAGKEVLIKAVIQAIPTYIMSIFKMPENIVRDLHSRCAQFWWGSSSNKRRMHWKKWEDLCKPKCLGGMGFRRLDVFNDALLTKQGWRIMRDENSLVARVFKAKYYPKGDFLTSSLGYEPSYAWKGIWASKSLLKEGLVWRVGNGRNIQIWQDPWLYDEKGKYVTTPCPDGNYPIWVADLILEDKTSWDMEMIERWFNERDKQIILSIPISPQHHNDYLAWAFTDSGVYTVRSGYLFGLGASWEQFENFWPIVWKAGVIPKASQFWWKVCAQILPTRALLKCRHVAQSDDCTRCRTGKEDDWHAIFECPQIATVWQNLEIDASNMREKAHSIGQLLTEWAEGFEPKRLHLLLTVGWQIWFSRNEHVFNDRCVPKEIIMGRARSICEELEKAKKMSTRQGKRSEGTYRASVCWNAPPQGIIKVNVDAATAQEGWIGLGAVARDWKGEVVVAATSRIQANWSPTIAEAKAIYHGLQLVQRFGHQKVIVESDCLSLIQRLNKPSLFLSELDIILEDILMLSFDFLWCDWSHVKRDGNTVAHNLAKFILAESRKVWLGIIPPPVKSYVLMDSLSMN